GPARQRPDNHLGGTLSLLTLHVHSHSREEFVVARPRNFAAEYARRVARGMARGLTRSQARGHPAPGQRFASGYEPSPYDRRLEEGLKLVREGRSIPRAAAAVDE